MYYKNCTKSQKIILEQPQIGAKMLRCSSGHIGFSKNIINITKTLLYGRIVPQAAREKTSFILK
jgi:hypothetical protein